MVPFDAMTGRNSMVCTTAEAWPTCVRALKCSDFLSCNLLFFTGSPSISKLLHKSATPLLLQTILFLPVITSNGTILKSSQLESLPSHDETACPPVVGGPDKKNPPSPGTNQIAGIVEKKKKTGKKGER